jgi:hypothetical protein
MFDIVKSDPATRELMRIMNDGACDYNTEGRMEGMREIAKNLLQNNVDASIIASSSRLSISEIEALKTH